MYVRKVNLIEVNNNARRIRTERKSEIPITTRARTYAMAR